MNIKYPAKIAAAGVLIVAANVLLSTSAWAAGTNIVADAVCDPDTGVATINYTSTSWRTDGDIQGENTQIDILFDTTIVDSQPYESPDYAFSGSAVTTAAGGSTVAVTASAVGIWAEKPNFPTGQSSSITVTIPEDCTDPGPTVTGRFTGGGIQANTDGVRTTYGLTIHCDLLLSNNLELNWRGNRFHMTEHLETITCSDDPEIIQAPPVAPIDTLIGVGTGRYNNTDGYTIDFTLRDFGEPGVFDEAAFLIYETANPGNVVLEIPLQRLDGGNLQAHADQPHRKNRN